MDTPREVPIRPDLLAIMDAAYASAPDAGAWRARVLDAAATFGGTGAVVAVGSFQQGRWGYSETSATIAEEVRRAFVRAGELLEEATLPPLMELSGQTGSMSWRGDFDRECGPYMYPYGVRDCLGIHGYIDERRVAGLYVCLDRRQRIGPEQVRRFRLFGVHLGAARRAVERTRDEAWIAPDGRVHDAEGPARAHRDELALRVRAIDALRTRGARRSAGDDALDGWRGLVAGRWSLIERFDSDGRRYFVARENIPAVARRLRLSRVEASAVSLLGMGHSQKFVAYHLGVSEPTLSRHVQRAMLKLKVRSRSELMMLARRLDGRA